MCPRQCVAASGDPGHETTSTSCGNYRLSRNRIFEAIVLNASCNADESAAITKSPVGWFGLYVALSAVLAMSSRKVGFKMGNAGGVHSPVPLGFPSPTQ